MQCVVLAGGLATRMRPATDTLPKWLLPVAGRPFADWQLDWLASQGVDDVVACIGYLGDQIRSAVGDGRRHGLAVRYSEDGPELVGTAGALRLAAARDLLDTRFLVVYGDSYLPVDVAAVWERFLADDRPALMTVYRDDAGLDVLNAAYDDGLVLRYHKAVGPPRAGGPIDDASAPALDHIDYGLSAFERSLFEPGAPPLGGADLADVFEALAAEGRLGGFRVRERFYEIGSPSGLRDLEELLASRAPSPGDRR